MKIKNLLVLASLFFIGTLSSGFIQSSSDITPEENRGESFAEFLSHFDKVELPFTLDLKDSKKYKTFKTKKKVKLTQEQKKEQARMDLAHRNSKVSLGRTDFIPEVSRGRFSRMGPPVVHPVARFYPNKNMVAVIYTSSSRFSTEIDEVYKMLVFDLKGNVVFPQNELMKKSKKKMKRSHRFNGQESFLLAQSSIARTTTCQIDEKGRIWQNTYDNQWKENLKEKGYQENQLVNFELKTTKVFEFNKEGTLVELNHIPSDARASLN